MAQRLQDGIASSREGLAKAWSGTKKDWAEFFHEVQHELTPVDVKPWGHYANLIKVVPLPYPPPPHTSRLCLGPEPLL